MDAIKRKKQIYKVTIVGSIANAILVVIKLLAGILGHSSAMIADAIHSISDFITDLIVLVFVKISSKPKDTGHAYGHGKFETLATAIIGFILLAVGLGICWEGLKKIYNVIVGIGIESPDIVAFWAAIISIVIKEGLYHYTKRTGDLVKSELVVANAWHHRSDAFSSIGTALGVGGAILLGNKWVVLDPIAAVIVSFFIMKVAVRLMAPSMNDLLEKSLPENIQTEIINIISSIPEIKDPHNLRTRRIGNDFAIEVHVRVNPEMRVSDAHKISRDAENMLREKYGPNTHVAIHIEPIK
ncbi:MAG: cation diffusion facilitator family transporter [Bacteroidales bacterium]|nr:cation diffusion facilitator family transporter [Bacteroidales bacterium]